jgi:two-component system invasion response regulator UvrY
VIRVIVADDHMLVRQGLRRLLEDAPDIEVVGEAGTGQETMKLISTVSCSLLLLDISLPDRNGLEVLKDVHALRPHLPVLILSVYPEDQYAIRAFRAGAAGYLMKAAAANELLDAVRRTGQGSKYITPAVAEKLAENFQNRRSDTQLPHEQLSDREFEVLERIAKGLSVAEISKTLGLSPKTISTYRSRILQKMGLKNSAELMHYAFENQLVS